MSGEVKNAIIMELLRGNMETNYIQMKTGASERHIQRVRNEFDEADYIMVNPICKECGDTWQDSTGEGLVQIRKKDDDDTFFDVNVIFDESFMEVMEEYQWEVCGDEGMYSFLCPDCSLKKIMAEEQRKIESKKQEIERGPKMASNKKPVQDFSDEYWEVDLPEEVKACGKCNKEVPVRISDIAYKKMNLFMKWSGSCEWLAYLVGEFDGDKAMVTDLYIPSQDASSALVNNVISSDYNKMKIIGVIHSHHEMGGAAKEGSPQFSGHDEKFINSNHNISLLIAKDGISGLVRIKTPCGSYIRVKAKVTLVKDYPFDVKNLKEEFQSKINSQWTKKAKRFSGNKKKEIVVTDGKGEIIDLDRGYNYR